MLGNHASGRLSLISGDELSGSVRRPFASRSFVTASRNTAQSLIHGQARS